MEQREINLMFKKYYVDIKNIDHVILELKKGGATQMECTKALVLQLGLAISEADEIVINATAWKENKLSIEKFRDEMLKVGEKIKGLSNGKSIN